MSDEQRDKSWDADPATPEQLQLVERVCNGLGFEGYFDTTCGWWRNEWNRPVFVPVVRSIALAYEFGGIDACQSDANEESDVLLPAGTNLYTHSAHTEVPADGYVTITTDQSGECVAVTRNDEEGRILRTLWKRFADPVPQVNPGRVFLVATGDFCDGAPTYTRHSDAPPGNMYAECLYTEPKLDCTEAAAVLEPTAPQAATVKESLQVAPDLVERVDGVLQGEWVITGPDGTTFRGATPFRAALMANRHRVQTDPVAAKQFQDVIEQGRREAEEERARLLAEHGTLNCPACGGSGYIGDVIAAPPAPPAEPIPYTRSPFKNGSQWVTFNIRAEHADRAAHALDGAPAAEKREPIQPLTRAEIADLWDMQNFHITDVTLAEQFVRDVEDRLGIPPDDAKDGLR